MKIQVYSAIYGEYDHPKPTRMIESYDTPIMYTDSDRTAAEAVHMGWEARVVRHHYESPHGDPSIVVPMLNHKFWKTHPDIAVGMDYDMSIWIDGSIEVTNEFFTSNCVEALGNADWSHVPHPARQCIYPEAEYSATLTWRYDAESILNQMYHYQKFHPPGWALFATGVNIRRHTDHVFMMSDLWWEEILNWSHQDQISLPVLQRIMEDKVPWNQNLTWFKDWTLHPHG